MQHGLVWLLPLSLLCAQEPTPPAANTLSAAEQAAGFRLLFDGKTTNGWRGFRKHTFPATGWSVDAGTLHVHKGGGGGDIMPVDQFTDFDLRFAWKVAPGANSGVMYRVSERENAPWRTGPEYQVLDDAGHVDGKDARTAAGSLYALAAGEGRTLQKVGAWNEARIVVDQNRVQHWLNGKLVVTAELGSPALAGLIAASKFAKMPGFAKEPRGFLCFQDHGDDVWYRDIRIQELHQKPAQRLFDGKTLTGWTAHLNDGKTRDEVWSVAQDGVLVCKGRPAGYLRTEADYDHFTLRVVWRWNPETKATGNSGVLIRMTGPDKVWPKSIEAQLQHENAGDFWNIDDVAMQPDPARTKGRNTKKLTLAERPVGEWNEYEIVADGRTVTLKVNGSVQNVALDCADGAGKICLQSEGCEIQFREVSLVPLR